MSGYLTRDPKITHQEVRDGRDFKIVSFSLAHTRVWYDGKGERQERTTFVDFSAFGSDATYIAKYLKKGSFAVVQFTFENHEYPNKDGVTIRTFQFKVLEIQAPKLNRVSNEDDAPPYNGGGSIGGIDDEMPY
jgi:single stranded DNA-binding protein